MVEWKQKPRGDGEVFIHVEPSVYGTVLRAEIEPLPAQKKFLCTVSLETPGAGRNILTKRAALYFHLSVAEASLIDAKRRGLRLLEEFRGMVKQNPNLYRDLILAAEEASCDADFEM